MPIGIDIPIIDQLFHPSLGLLDHTAHASNPFTPPFAAVVPPFNFSEHTYGISLQIHTVGAAHGYEVGFPQVYRPRLGRLTVAYEDWSHLAVIQEVQDWEWDDQIFLWKEPLPKLVTITIAPDVELDIYWLQAK